MRGTGNKYVYADNNPLSKVDIYGMYTVSIDGIDTSVDGAIEAAAFSIAESHPTFAVQVGSQATTTPSSGNDSSSSSTQTASGQQRAHAQNQQINGQPVQEAQNLEVSATAKGTTVIIMSFDIDALSLSFESRTGTHAFRDNNPGNIRDGNFAENNGAVGQDNGFAIFPSSQIGFNALGSLLSSSSYQKLTVDQAINRYAPPSENDTATYQSTIRNAVGVGGDVRMSTLNSGQLGSMEHGIAQHEGFYVPGTVRMETIDIPGLLQAIP
jgi:hypothetical protein